MNSLRMAYLCMALAGIASQVDAAVFTITNKSMSIIYVNPVWAGRSGGYDIMLPGQTIQYNSGFSGVGVIKWMQKLPASAMQADPKAFSAKIYQAATSLGALNLGGKFEILNDGSYSFMFGVDGSGNNTAATVDHL